MNAGPTIPAAMSQPQMEYYCNLIARGDFSAAALFLSACQPSVPAIIWKIVQNIATKDAGSL